jgi:CRP-like cAMP-binding protein
MAQFGSGKARSPGPQPGQGPGGIRRHPLEMSVRGRQQSGNQLLNRLTPGGRDALGQWLRVEQIPQGTILTRRFRPLTHAWFPHHGLISLTISTEEGRMAEVAAIGREGAVGLEAAFEPTVALSDSVVQIAGAFSVVRAEHLRAVVAEHPAVGIGLSRYGRALTAQLQQSVACNALHRLDQRCCRWLITAQGRAGTDELPLTQETLAGILGAGRPGISGVLRSLEQAGLIGRRRGRIRILNRGGIANLACECDDAVVRMCGRLGLGPGTR